MAKQASILTLLFLFLVCSKASAGEIVSGKTPGSIMLRDNGREVVYENITGGKEGFDRRLMDINGSPGLQVIARYNFYYTLVIVEDGLLIDCAYFDVRNIYNGARASAGMCGLNMQLSEVYDEVAQDYSNKWRASIFSFDTSPVFEKGLATNFLLGKIGDIEVYDRYPLAEALENAAPQKYIKSSFGCFNFGDAVGFLVFLDKDKPRLQYLDVLQSEDPMKLQRMNEQDLKKLAVGKCV
ncbi:S41 family peptidase [Pseudomonas fluorescens]|uniref:Lipoprotein n=1 Tax=Pseudomonas fluorescens TaxID=294 RepID=A0A5E7FNN2_PSEFL|nr:S41 family peptidase [Pseudomonas fluorescens]VVO40432.1 hypothetical protein PS691_05688 [Pseudomonas fluorescens]